MINSFALSIKLCMTDRSSGTLTSRVLEHGYSNKTCSEKIEISKTLFKFP